MGRIMKKLNQTFAAFTMAAVLMTSGSALAGITFSPYVSIKSTKSVNPDKKDKTKENETIKQRQEAGVMAGVSFWRLFKFQLGVGQSKLTTTEKVSEAKDEYGEIDYEQDLDMSTDDPTKDFKLTETQNVGKASLIIDPSFWIFIMRAKAGVTARQRIMESEVQGEAPVKHTEDPTYKPHSGLGVGVRFGPRMYFMVEYNALHYKFPEIEPFERELSVNYNISF